MSLEQQSAPLAAQAERRHKKLSAPVKAALATAVVAGVITLGVFYSSGMPLFASDPGDNVSSSDQKSRIDAFQALGYLTVSKVSAAEFQSAVDSMHLTPDEQLKLREGLVQDSGTSTAAAKNSASNATANAVHPATVHAPDTAVQAAPHPAAQSAPAARPTLVWVRLWDSDVEDGDVVRIDSAGYSRTVTLTRAGVTFAVPVSATGQIRIAGIRDGDGGGITVGLGSGSAQAILPIMSVGQVLTLNVRTN